MEIVQDPGYQSINIARVTNKKNKAIITREEGWDKKKDAEGGREFWAGGKKRELLSFVIKSLFSSKQPDLSPAGLNKCCLMDWQS